MLRQEAQVDSQVGETEQPDESNEQERNAFFEQLLTVRIPTAGPAPQQPAQNAQQPAARDAGGAVAEQETERQSAAAIEQVPTVRVAATHPPAPGPTRATGAPVADPAPPSNMPAIASAPVAADSPVEVARAVSSGRRRGRAPMSRQRRGVAIAAFTVIALVVAMMPVLYILSSSQPAHAPHTTGFAQGANPPPGWRPQDWASAARQQAELNYVNQLISHMTLDEEIGQMIMLGFLETQMSPTLAYTIKQYHLGSVVLYAWNITGADQVKQLTTQIQAEGDIPLLIATDQEGGSVNRLQAVDGPLPSAYQMGATNNPS